MKRPNKRRKLRQNFKLQGSKAVPSRIPWANRFRLAGLNKWNLSAKLGSPSLGEEARRWVVEILCFLCTKRHFSDGSSLQLLSQSQQLAWSLWPLATSFREQTCHQTYVCFIRVAALRKRQKNDPIKSHDLSIALWLKGWTGGTIFKVKIR